MNDIQEETLLQAKHVGVRCDGKNILHDICFTLKKGEIVSIVGPNGAGKTTLLKAILGLQGITQGHIERQAGLRVGYMPQKCPIDPILPLRVIDFLQMGQLDCIHILKNLHIEHLKYSAMQSLSGGEHQRVLLARALLHQPNLLVLDEPAQGVDLNGQAELYQIIADIRDKTQCGIIIVSHNLQIVMEKTDYVICLQQHICCHGKPETISGDPAFIKLFGQLPGLALYTHAHDHHHDMHGDIKDKES